MAGPRKFVDRIHHVYVRKATDPTHGDGLFASKDFKKGEQIIPYTGEELDKEEYDERYPDDDPEYVLELNKNKFIDAKNDKGLGRYANHKIRSKANARFDKNGVITAQKGIKQAHEIFVTYRRDWKPVPK